ncbi:MAG TPA: DUF308 domain-containing protein [Kribbella sp.]|nr:DUF308 domain-containing protein [Kribbella sp.]
MSTASQPLSPGLANRFDPLRLLLALACLAIGIAVLVWPDVTLLVIAVLFGLQLIIAGATRIAIAAALPASSVAAHGSWRTISILLGVLTLIAGVICLFRPGASLVAIAWIVAIGWLIDGVSELVAGFQSGRTGPERITLILFGALTLIAAILVTVFPGKSLVVFTRIGGIVLIVFGLVELVAAFRRRAVAQGTQPAV